MGLLQGKKAVIIGGADAGSMGHAIARRFVAEGTTVTEASRRADVCAAFAREIGGFGTGCNLTDRAEVLPWQISHKRAWGASISL